MSKDGSKLDVVSTGLRAPNGIGMGPGDVITTADNEGNWVPSSRVDICKPGRFNGHVFTSHTKEPPTSFEPPLLWLPHTYEMDNSSGGQAWVASDKWGPFQGDMLHTSYGACALFHVMQQEVDGVPQGGLCEIPAQVRDRHHARAFQRARWTALPRRPSRLAIEGTAPGRIPAGALHGQAGADARRRAGDEAAANDLQNYGIEQWNYKWTKNYGSPEFSVTDPEKKGPAERMPCARLVFGLV